MGVVVTTNSCPLLTTLTAGPCVLRPVRLEESVSASQPAVVKEKKSVGRAHVVAALAHGAAPQAPARRPHPPAGGRHCRTAISSPRG